MNMKVLYLISVALCFSEPASSAVCNNNCGRQVAGTGRNDPPLASRSSQCGAFVTKFVTVSTGPGETATASLPPAIKGRSDHAPRQDALVPTITGIKPAYARACPDVTAYWSACQCFEGIKPTTITVTGLTGVTPTSVTSGTASASCTVGAEFALHVLPERSNLCRNVLQKEYPYLEAEDLDLKNLVQGRVPVGVGLATYPNYDQQDDTKPVDYYGVKGPVASNLRCNILVHRGYIKSTYPGSYEILINEPEDVMFVWVGDKALSGYNAENADIRAQDGRNTYPYSTWIYFKTVDEYIPFRIFWANGKGRGSFSAIVIPDFVLTLDLPEGVVLDNPVLYSNCSGDSSPAPAWPAWQDEVWG